MSDFEIAGKFGIVSAIVVVAMVILGFGIVGNLGMAPMLAAVGLIPGGALVVGALIGLSFLSEEGHNEHDEHPPTDAT